MWIVLAWVSPGIVVLLALIYKWYKGNDIIASDIEMLLLMSCLGIFIPVVEKRLLYWENPKAGVS